jgi:hypothetical protein
MNRRDFLRSASIVSASAVFPKTGNLFAKRLESASWRTFELTTRVEVLKYSGPTRIWLPAALIKTTPYQKTLANKFTADGGSAKLVENGIDALGVVGAEFPAGVRPVLTLMSRVATKDYSVDFSAFSNMPKVDRSGLAHYLRPTKLLPTDVIVKTRAIEITSGAKANVEKARVLRGQMTGNESRIDMPNEIRKAAEEIAVHLGAEEKPVQTVFTLPGFLVLEAPVEWTADGWTNPNTPFGIQCF